jgi:hypothetical protein
MSDRVVPIRPPSEQLPRLDELVLQTRTLAASGQDTTRIHFDHPHFRQRLVQRKVSMRQVLETLREGSAEGTPTRDRYGDWRIKLRHTASGRPVQVVVAVKQDHLVLVTVF